ncbi:hypothetical protein H0H87_003687 [Tephrocybe sp. NHM501043]|nr:hypothetical protein H0H87_003687 [Tephrocybe sp. NHM501043]
MAIWSLTKEKIAKLKLQAEEKEHELLVLLEKSPKSLWNSDLDLFLAEWDTNCKEWVDASTAGKKGKKKQAVLKTRKSIGNRARSDSDDDDFRPTKAPAKRKPVAESSRSKPVAKKSVKNEDNDVDMEEAPVKKPVAHKRKVAEKKAIKIDSDDDDDEIERVSKPLPKKTAKTSGVKSDSEDEVTTLPLKSKGKTKEAPKHITSDDDDDDDGYLRPTATAKGKGKAVPVMKRKSPALSEDSDDGAYTKPAVKKKKVTDFFDKAAPKAKEAVARPVKKLSKSMKPASPPKPKAKLKPKIISDSDDDDDDDDDFDSTPAPKAALAPARAARSTAAKKYIELSDDDDDEGDAGGDVSMFVDE